VQALIVPRLGAEPGDHWYPFVAERVEAGSVPGLTGAAVRAPTEKDADAAGSLVLVGHEDSAGTISDFLSSLPAGRHAAGTLLVAPPAPEGDWHAAGHLRVLQSDAEAALPWERHGADLGLREGGKRFYGDHEIAVLVNLAAVAFKVAVS
jgi:predicted alpha/beta hydrolase family esterase